MNNILLLTRAELVDASRGLSFDRIIGASNFNVPLITFFSASITIFIDGDRARVLKDRSRQVPYDVSLQEAFKLLRSGMYFRLAFPEAQDRGAWHFRVQNLTAMTYAPQEEILEPV